MTTEHTPGPWTVEYGPPSLRGLRTWRINSATEPPQLIADSPVGNQWCNAANAEIIVKAVNNHADMLDALREIVDIAQAAQECQFCDSPGEHEHDCPVFNARAIIDRIEETA